jgi:hypothetical protein
LLQRLKFGQWSAEIEKFKRPLRKGKSVLLENKIVLMRR